MIKPIEIRLRANYSSLFVCHTPLMKGTIMARRKYGLGNFIFDAVLFVLTGGLWLIWIFVREMRNR